MDFIAEIVKYRVEQSMKEDPMKNYHSPVKGRDEMLMKRFFCIVSGILLLLGLFGCASNNNDSINSLAGAEINDSILFFDNHSFNSIFIQPVMKII